MCKLSFVSRSLQPIQHFTMVLGINKDKPVTACHYNHYSKPINLDTNADIIIPREDRPKHTKDNHSKIASSFGLLFLNIVKSKLKNKPATPK